MGIAHVTGSQQTNSKQLYIKGSLKHGPTDAKKRNAPQTKKLEGIPTCIFIT
jgi:hypothetical protein